jgi:RNA polymerase sigma-70 factor (ECF subfamily)
MDNRKNGKIFELLYKENIDSLFRFAHFRVSDREEAIDIAEESFVRLWKEMEAKEVREHRALLYKIARNLIIDWYRKEKSLSIPQFKSENASDEDLSIDMFASPLPHAEILLESRMVIEKISKLNATYRESVYLRYVEELSPREIAEILGVSANNISVRINRGTLELRELLNKKEKE